MVRSRVAIVVLACVLLAGGLLRAWLIAAKRTLNHDEAISYLCAAGKQGLYRTHMLQHKPPLGTWVPAAELKSFLEPQAWFCLGRIGHDLAETDIHPPLYFWLLHVWRLLFGLHLWTGPALNALLALVGAVLLFKVGRAALGDELAAVTMTAVWLLSPAVVVTCFEARHYDLLAVMTIAFVGAFWSCMARDALPRARHWLLLSLVTAGGLLTHYHFVLLPLSAGAWALLDTDRDRRRLLSAATAMALGAAVFVAVHPRFGASILRAREQAQGFELADVPARIEAALVTYAAFWARGPVVNWLVHKYWIVLAAGVACLTGLLIWLAVRRPVNRLAPADRLAVWLLLGLASTNVALYLAGVSPKHAMGPQYPAIVWPLLAWGLVRAVQTLARRQVIVLTMLAAAVLVSSTHATGRDVRKWRAQPDPARFLACASAVVIDNTARGVLPAIVWHIPDGTPVLAAQRDHLLKHAERWLPELPPRAILVTVNAYGNETHDERRLMQLLDGQFDITVVGRGVFGVGRAYILSLDSTSKSGRIRA